MGVSPSLDRDRAILLAAEMAARAVLDSAKLEAARIEAEAAAHDPLPLFVEAGYVRHKARVEGTRTVRKARDEAYRQAMERVLALLGGLRDDPRYPEVLKKLVAEAFRALPTGRVLRVDPRDEHLVAAYVRRGVTVHANLTTLGGVVLDSGDGRTVRNTVEDRLARSEETLRRLVEKTLE